jgi:aldehyde dehydrogenase (NAD+)/aldehyde dehydrogenase
MMLSLVKQLKELLCLNQGEICTTPSRIFHESIADKFIERMLERIKKSK